jgi:small subunit ribosomal protein S16
MLKIRLKPLGRKKKPFYKILVAESSSPRDGKAVEELGYYDPFKKLFYVKKSRLVHYLKVGAHPTNTLRHLILKSLPTKA